MSSSQNLIIPYSWQGLDYTPTREDENTGKTIWGTRKYTIFIWGHNEKNEPSCWVIEDYMPHCYVRIEQEISNEKDAAPQIMYALNQNLVDWVRANCNKPGKSYLKSLSRRAQIIEGYVMEERLPLFYYKTKKYLIYKVFFSLEVGMQTCYKYLNSNQIKFSNGIKLKAKAYNNGDSDRIPTDQKLIVELGLDRCDWIYGNGYLVDNDCAYTTIYNEYCVPYKSMQKLPKEYSEKLGYPKPTTISFDAETFSEIYNLFPKAARLNDCMYAMGFRYRKYNSLEDDNPTIINYLFVIWDRNKHGDLDQPDENVYGQCVIVYCLDETEFYTMLFKYIVKLDPSWFISFNGLGFDWDYLQTRCDVLGVKVPNLSRIRNWFKSQFVVAKWKKWVATYPQYPGRIDVDMLNIIRGQFKMNSYKLKNVAKELLPKKKDGEDETKVDLPYKEQFRIFGEKDRHGMGKIMDYLAMDVKLPEMLYDKLSTPVYLHTNGGVMNINPLKLYTEGQSIRCICQLYERLNARGMFVNTRDIPKSTGKYIGGLVWAMKQGLHRNVIIFDFNSLYPNKMKAENICYSTKIDEEEQAALPEEERIPDEDINVVEGEVPIIDKKTKEIVSRDYHKFRFVKKHVRLGLLPEIVTTLNALRTEYKKQLAICKKKAKACKEAGDEEGFSKWSQEADIWNVKQAAVKVSANSIYGFMGMKSGKFSFVEGAMATTLAGQAALKRLIKILEEEYNVNVIYGDTDSAMVILPDKYVTAANYHVRGGELADEISDKFEEDIKLACENFMMVFMAFTPKRYAAIKINPHNPSMMPTEEEIIKYDLLYIKGLICVRGNTCAIVAENFKKILLKTLIGYNFKKLTDYIADIILRICRRDFPLEDYTFVQRLGANYKSENQEMAMFSDRLKQMGRNPGPGEELEYVYMRTRGDTYKGNKMQPPDLFVTQDCVLDTARYIKHCFAKPIQEILTVAFDDSQLTAYEKKIIQPRKPTKAQKVTPVWHLKLYVERYILKIHKNWVNLMMSIRYMREKAKEAGIDLNYVIEDSHVKEKMMKSYGIDWQPAEKDPEIEIKPVQKEPIHRYKVWDNPALALETFIDDFRIRQLMMEKYGIKWSPPSNPENVNMVNKEPIHRYEIWKDYDKSCEIK